MAAVASVPTAPAQPVAAANTTAAPPAAVANVAQPAAAAGNTASTYPMASLYVGDLHTEVTEAQLFEKFSTAGPVLSIRVCRDAVTRRSLGYAYVNFQNPADAERALDTMNFDLMNNKPIRIMWSQRDPSLRRSGAGNIFIKNLDKRIDTKSMFDTFSLFGTILSCKIATDENGQSRGYGFIHFETEEAALQAIERVNGMLLDGKKVFVGKFKSRSDRMSELGESAHRFTNVFVKNFGDELDSDKLTELFKKYGTITSACVMTDSTGKSKGFGFVAFAEPEAAEAAVEQLNEYELPVSKGKLTVCRAQKKSERQAELRRRYEAARAERQQRYQGVNLYVKNLDDTVNDDTLRQHFARFGNITSAKVMCDETNRSKGFGFVCFERAENATKAIVDMHNTMFMSKPLFVMLAQRKEERKAALATQYMQRLAALRYQTPNNMPNTIYAPQQGGFFVPTGVPGQRPYLQGQVRNQGPRWNSVGGGQYGGVPNYVMPNANYGSVPRHRPQLRSQYGAGPRPRVSMGQGGMRQSMQNKPAQNQYYQYAAGQAQQLRQQPMILPHQQMGGAEPQLTSHFLAQATSQQQKQIIGERLYPMITQLAGDEDVGKITGMMLEMDNAELLVILDNPDLLKAKVNEASDVLRRSRDTGTA